MKIFSSIPRMDLLDKVILSFFFLFSFLLPGKIFSRQYQSYLRSTTTPHSRSLLSEAAPPERPPCSEKWQPSLGGADLHLSAHIIWVSAAGSQVVLLRRGRALPAVGPQHRQGSTDQGKQVQLRDDCQASDYKHNRREEGGTSAEDRETKHAPVWEIHLQGGHLHPWGEKEPHHDCLRWARHIISLSFSHPKFSCSRPRCWSLPDVLRGE